MARLRRKPPRPRKVVVRYADGRSLSKAEYREYLKSDHWQEIKRRYRRSHLPKCCRVCGNPNYELHHKTYKRLGSERLLDLAPLCRTCHEEAHRIAASDENNLTIWSVVRYMRRKRRGLRV